MNNPIRRWSMLKLEFPQFKALLNKHNIDPKGKRLLDIACGSGYSNQLLLEAYRPSKLIGFDFMENQIRWARKLKNRSFLFQGDATNLGLKANSIDGAFGFGFLHHISNWKDAVAQITNVICPGGFFILEEPNGTAAKFFRNTFRFAIPRGGEFPWNDLESTFKTSGFKLLDSRKLFLDCFRVYLFLKE